MAHLDADLMALFLSGKLDAAARSRCEAHLKICSRCRDALAQERRLSGLLALPDEAPSAPRDPERIIRNLKRRTSPGGARRRLLGFVVVAAGALCGWQIGVLVQPRIASPLPSHPHLSTLEREIAGRLDAVEALVRYPWLGDDLEWIEMFVQFLERQGG